MKEPLRLGRQHLWPPFQRGMWWVRPGGGFYARLAPPKYLDYFRYYRIRRPQDVSFLPRGLQPYAHQQAYVPADLHASPGAFSWQEVASSDGIDSFIEAHLAGRQVYADQRDAVRSIGAYFRERLASEEAPDDGRPLPPSWALGAGPLFFLVHPHWSSDQGRWLWDGVMAEVLPTGRIQTNVMWSRRSNLHHTKALLADTAWNCGADLMRLYDERALARGDNDAQVSSILACALPLFAMCWLRGDGGLSPGSPGRFTTPDVSDWTPRGGQAAIRQGLSWIEVPMGAPSAALTHQYYNIVKKLARTCPVAAASKEYALKDIYGTAEVVRAPVCPICEGHVAIVEGGPLLTLQTLRNPDAYLDKDADEVLRDNMAWCPSCAEDVPAWIGYAGPTGQVFYEGVSVSDVLCRVHVQDNLSSRAYVLEVIQIPGHPVAPDWSTFPAASPRNDLGKNVPADLSDTIDWKFAFELDSFRKVTPREQALLLGLPPEAALDVYAEDRNKDPRGDDA